jgi:uncharacterized membrane protein YqjE
MNRAYAMMAALAFECVGLVTVLVLLGQYFDRTYGWGGMGAAGGAVLGVVGWVSHLIVVLRQLAKDEENGDTKP